MNTYNMLQRLTVPILGVSSTSHRRKGRQDTTRDERRLNGTASTDKGRHTAAADTPHNVRRRIRGERSVLLVRMSCARSCHGLLLVFQRCSSERQVTVECPSVKGSGPGAVAVYHPVLTPLPARTVVPRGASCNGLLADPKQCEGGKVATLRTAPNILRNLGDMEAAEHGRVRLGPSPRRPGG